MKEQVVECCGVFTDNLNIKDDLKTLEGMIFKMNKIPKIINLSKVYDGFEIIVKDGHLSKTEGKLLILLDKKGKMFSKRYKVYEIEIKLNDNYFTHTQLLNEILSKEAELSSYEVIGQIIHLNLTEKQLPYKKIIGEILNKKTGKTVINKNKMIENEFRNYDFEILAPKDKNSNKEEMNTIHVENGVKIFIDLKNVYWSSRLQEERRRLISKIEKGNIICDPFCGTGPVVLPLLKLGCKVYANDLNPRAIECLEKSIKLNKLESANFELSCDYANNFLKRLSDKKVPVDHFIFNLPEFSLDYISDLKLFKNDFLIHCYFFVRFSSDIVDKINFVKSYLKVKLKKEIPLECIQFVRPVSPTKHVYKLEIFRNKLFN